MSDQVVATNPTGGVVSTAGNMSNLPKLNGKNFQSWKELVVIVLTLKGLKKAITDDKIDDVSDLHAS